MMAWFDLHIERTPKLHIIEVCRSSTHTHPESNLDKLLDPKNSENRFWELSYCRIRWPQPKLIIYPIFILILQGCLCGVEVACWVYMLKVSGSNPGQAKIFIFFMIIYFSSAQIYYFHIQISLNNITFQRYKRRNKKFGQKKYTAK